ncbi:MAG: cyclic pyranopterin monophosphate synthase MoaC [Methanospirillaceae archaeon]|nr:cyclic pyranopterin monophosphate synthase MoaC [Methanospirillaceae archaeon]
MSDGRAEFSHISDDRAKMVDITTKTEVKRTATAKGRIFLRDTTLRAIAEGTVLKGNVFATARVAAILAIKDTSRMIPLCHAISITGTDVSFVQEETSIEVTVTVSSVGKTGVEMEALTGVSIALLTIWDMVKSAEKDNEGQYPETRIENICVVRKKKG